MSVIKKFIIKSFKKQKPIISLKDISISFNKNHQILDHVSLDISKGQVLGLLGPNGAGKSTLMNIISGLLKPSSGSVYINGKNVTNYPVSLRSKEFKLSIVPQTGGYFESLSAELNLLAIGEILIKDEKKRINRIEQLIAKFELDSVRDVKANHLSGGQKKKLVIALALLGDPKILLLDEPFAALDVLTIKTLQQIIVNLQEEKNISIILCDHQARDLLTCVDVALVLSNCKIIAMGTPSQLLQNNDAKTAYFGDSFKIS